MKKSLILLLSMSSIALANVNLMYGVDFKDAMSNLSDDSVLPNLGYGTTNITVSSTGDKNLATSSDKFGSTGNGSYNTNGNRMIVISNSAGLGVDTDTGFSLTLNYRDKGDDWSNIATFAIGSSTFYFQTGGDTRTVHIFGADGATALSAGASVSAPSDYGNSQWYTLVLTAIDDNFTFSMYSTGDTPTLLSSTTFTAAAGNLTMFRQGSDVSNRTSDSIRVDNFGVYDGVLTDSMAIELVKYEKTNSTLKTSIVPEPTTATLSLLALAGLAARRRRK